MDILLKEIGDVVDSNYKLSFPIPSEEELSKIRMINRDRTEEEKKNITKASKNLQEIMKMIETGALHPDLLPELKALLDVARSTSGGDEQDE